MSQAAKCPNCGETYYVEWLGTLEDGSNGHHCDICDVDWLIPPDPPKTKHDGFYDDVARFLAPYLNDDDDLSEVSDLPF